MIRIQSVIDVITNSSMEVFVFKDIQDLGKLKKELKELVSPESWKSLRTPWRFDWTKKEDYSVLDLDNRFIDTTSASPEEARRNLSELLERDSESYGDQRRFDHEFSEYHKLYKKFRKSGLDPIEFLKRYTDENIYRYWSIGEPWSFYHLNESVISGWCSDSGDYVDWEDIDKVLAKYKKSEHLRMS